MLVSERRRSARRALLALVDGDQRGCLGDRRRDAPGGLVPVIDKNDQVEVSVDGSSFTNLGGGHTKQVMPARHSKQVGGLRHRGRQLGLRQKRVRPGSAWVATPGRSGSPSVENTVYGIGILVKGFAYLDLNGSVHGTDPACPHPPGRRHDPRVSRAPGRSARWGLVHLFGTLHGTGFIKEGQAGGTITLSNAKGTITLDLFGPTESCLHRAAGGDLPIHHRAGQGHRRLRERRRLRIGEGHARG